MVWPSGRSVEIVAHRGASREAPENTLAAVRLAWEIGADAVEIDVQLSRDGRLMVIHDATLVRTAGRDGRVDELTAAELAKCDAGAWKGDIWRGEPVPALADVLATIPAGRRLFVELKCGSECVETLAADLEVVCDRPESVVLISFDADVLAAARRRCPRHQSLLVVEQVENADGQWLPTLGTLVRVARERGFQGLDLNASPGLDRSALELLRTAGLSSCAWTVNAPEEAIRLAEAGIDSLTTDDPRGIGGLF